MIGWCLNICTGYVIITCCVFLYLTSINTTVTICEWFQTGANEFGQLGDGTEKGRKQPKKVKQLQTEFVISVSCGAHCTAAIAEPREKNGTEMTRRLWVWGQNQVHIPLGWLALLNLWCLLLPLSFCCRRVQIIHAYTGGPLLQTRYNILFQSRLSYNSIE